MPERLKVPPTRSVLIQLRRRRETLLAAADLLERKRRVLAQKTLELLPRWEELQRQAHRELAGAYRSLRVTRMRSTSGELRQITRRIPPMISGQLQRQVMAGVPTYQISTERQPLRPRFGLLGNPAELDHTITSLRDAAERLAHLAAIGATLRSLAQSLQKTNRQVRVLSDHMIPLHEVTIREIEDILDEQERAYLFQLKRIR